MRAAGLPISSFAALEILPVIGAVCPRGDLLVYARHIFWDAVSRDPRSAANVVLTWQWVDPGEQREKRTKKRKNNKKSKKKIKEVERSGRNPIERYHTCPFLMVHPGI